MDIERNDDMSSIVVAPTRRAENTIYLAFSAVLVIFIQYAGAWIAGENTQPPYTPDLIIVGITAPIISAALIYSVPDEWLIHKLLGRRISTTKENNAEYFLLSSAALKTYKVRSLRIRSPDLEFNEERDIVLEAGSLDTPIWRLRGVIWFAISLWLTVPIMISVVGFSIVSLIGFFTIGIVVSIIVTYPSWKWYVLVSQVLIDSIEFHWLDRSLTAARRSEIPIEEPSESKIEFDMSGFTEAIYRGIKAVEDASKSPPKGIHLVPDVATPMRRDPERRGEEYPVVVKGRIYSSGSSGISEKTLQDLIVSEVEWLRELVRRTSWSSFRARFKELRGFLLVRGQETIKTILRLLIEEWRVSIKAAQASHAFSNLRGLCYHLREHNLLPPDNLNTIDEIIEFNESSMIDLDWAWNYYDKRMRGNIKITRMFEILFEEYVDDFIEYAQTAAYEMEVGSDLSYFEQQYKEVSGRKLLKDLTEDELDEAELMEYE